MRYSTLLLPLLLGSARVSAQVVDSSWIPIQFVRTRTAADSQEWNPDTLVLRNGYRFTVGLWGVEYVGQLPRGKHVPFLVLAAVGCYACDDITSIYIAWPRHGRWQTEANGYQYPGEITPEESDTAYFRSRLFIGRCLSESDGVLVWFQEERDSTHRWIPQVYRVHVQNDTVARGFLRGSQASLSATLRRVRAGQCREVKPRDQTEF